MAPQTTLTPQNNERNTTGRLQPTEGCEESRLRTLPGRRRRRRDSVAVTLRAGRKQGGRRAHRVHLPRPGGTPRGNHRAPAGKGGRLRLPARGLGQRIRRIPRLGAHERHILPVQGAEDEDGERQLLHCVHKARRGKLPHHGHREGGAILRPATAVIPARRRRRPDCVAENRPRLQGDNRQLLPGTGLREPGVPPAAHRRPTQGLHQLREARRENRRDAAAHRPPADRGVCKHAAQLPARQRRPLQPRRQEPGRTDSRHVQGKQENV